MITGVFVDPSSVGHGVGSIIVRHAIKIVQRKQDGPIRLEATLNAEHFYERFGFRPMQRYTVQRSDIELPVVLMQLDIEPYTSPVWNL